MSKLLYVVVKEVEWFDDDGEFEDFFSSDAFYFLDQVQALSKALEENSKVKNEPGQLITYKVEEKKFSDVELQ